MAFDNSDFHYLTILRELEKEATRLHGRRKASERGQAHRSSRVFRDLFGELGPKVEGANITLKLQASAELLVNTELASAATLRELSEGRPRLDRLAAGDWPPVVPAPRMVERFTALTIGMHSEAPGTKLATHAAKAFQTAVLPALAWGLVSHLYELPAHLREDAQQALSQHFSGKSQPHRTELVVGEDEQLRFIYLRMVEAWFALMGAAAPWGIDEATRTAARKQLAAWLALPLTDLDTLLWSSLGEHYTGQVAGSQRARVVEQASRHSAGSAGFMRDRLQLFEAANDPKLRKFRLLTESNLHRASKQRFAAEDPKPSNPAAAAHEACGAAFWLARACFGRHVGDQSHNLTADWASSKVLILLLRAAALLSSDPDLRLTCVRYAAGFATNPRYVRSGLVLDSQARLVDLYASMPGNRRSLVSLFRGRIAWQRWKAKQAKDPQGALKHYAEALRLHADPQSGFDAEAPVHFFSELMVVLDQTSKRKRREQSTLAAIDFITQRNYGIYFDIESEERMLGAGLQEYSDFKQVCLKAVRAKLKAAKNQEEVREENLEAHSDYDETVKGLHPESAAIREQVAHLRVTSRP